MDSRELLGLIEAYTAVYDENLREDLYEEYEYVDDLYDEELEEVVEEVIYDLLDEGYDFEDVEDILRVNLIEEVLSEARVDMAARAARRKEMDAASERSAKEARGRAAAKERSEKRAERIARVKGAIKGGIDKVKSAIRSGVSKAKEAGRQAKFQAVDKRVAKYATDRNLHPSAGMAARSKDPEKRRALRKKVAGDIASRAQVAAYNKGREVAQSATDTARRAKQGAKNVAARMGRGVSGAKSATKSGVKGAIRRAAEKVASGASKVAKRMQEDFEIWVEDLLDEGYDLSEYTWDEMADAYLNKKEEVENVEELYKGKHGQSPKEYADSRSQGGKMISGDSKMSGAEYTHGRRVKATNPGMQPDVGGKTKPKSQGRMDSGTRADLQYRKANLNKEELDIFDVVLEFLLAEGYVETLEEAEWIMANEFDSEDIDAILEGMSDRPLGLMHQFARGMKQKRGEKREKKYGVDREGNPTGKYSEMQHQKRQAKRERDADEQRRRDRGSMSRGTWDRD